MDSWSLVVKFVCCDTASQCEQLIYQLKGCCLLCQWGIVLKGVICKLLGVLVVPFIKNDLR